MPILDWSANPVPILCQSYVNSVPIQCQSIVSLMPIQFQSRLSCANPMSTLANLMSIQSKCSCPALSHQASANQAPILCLSSLSIQCQSVVSQLPIQCQSSQSCSNPNQSIADMISIQCHMPIRCQSKAAHLGHQSIANPIPIYRSNANLPVQCQSITNPFQSANLPIQNQSPNPSIIQS